jgi:transposase
MANYLNMDRKQQVFGLLQLGWSYRRIERETGVRRETISRYHQEWLSKAAKVPTGSALTSVSLEAKAAKVPIAKESASSAAPHADVIKQKLSEGFSYQRIWQDLVEEYGFSGSYDAVRRLGKKLKKKHPELVDVLHSAPGEEAQVDFFAGPLTLNEATGKWYHPWIFVMTLSHSRHAYQEAVLSQTVLAFIRCHENAFRFFGGVPRVIKLDNLKAGVAKACLYDPEVNAVYSAFAEHWGFCPVPCYPGKAEEKGKVERNGDYVKDNALKGRRFSSLAEANRHLVHWNRTIAGLRIHGTTRRQVVTHFLEVERDALAPLAPCPFEYFNCAFRKVHMDGHIQLNNAYYSVPPRLLTETVEVRYTERLLKVYFGTNLEAVHQIKEPGWWSTTPEHRPAHKPAKAEAYEINLLARAERIGSAAAAWARGAIEVRGPRSYRLIQGMLSLTRNCRKESVEWACELAQAKGIYQYKSLKRLAEQAQDRERRPELLQSHEIIRPLAEIGKEMDTIECRT